MNPHTPIANVAEEFLSYGILSYDTIVDFIKDIQEEIWELNSHIGDVKRFAPDIAMEVAIAIEGAESTLAKLRTHL